MKGRTIITVLLGETINLRSPLEPAAARAKTVILGGTISQVVKRIRTLLIINFLAITGAILIAYRNPASGYELSIYTGTPMKFWALVLPTICSSLYIFVMFDDYFKLPLASLSLSVISILNLPIIRRYYYLNEGDSLTHLGRTIDISTGALDPTNLLYPGFHILSIVLSYTTAIELNESMVIIAVSIMPIVYILFSSLSCRLIYPNTWAVTAGCVASLMLLPLSDLRFVTNELTRSMLPVVIFSILLSFSHRRLRVIAVLLLILPATVFQHPQIALSISLFLLGVVVSLWLIPKLRIDISEKTKIGSGLWSNYLYIFIFYSIINYVWMSGRDKFVDGFQAYILTLFSVSSPSAVRVDSLEKVGGSVVEIFLKSYLVDFIFGISTVFNFFLILYATYKIRKKHISTNDLKFMVVCVSSIPVLLLLLSDFVGGRFGSRYYHIVVSISVITGAVASYNIYSTICPPKFGRREVFVVLSVLMLLSVPLIHTSPYTYRPSSHISESQFEGYGTALEHYSQEVKFDNVRSYPYRYSDGSEGFGAKRRGHYTGRYLTMAPDHFAGNSLHEYYEESRVLAVTAADRKRDAILWKGFRYSQSNFEYLDNNEHIYKVHSSGDFDLYYVNVSDNEE